MLYKIMRGVIAAAVLLFLSASVNAQGQLGRIYAKVSLSDGDILEGRVKWGGHETIWNHTLDADHNIRDQVNRITSSRRRRRVSSSSTRSFSVLFGHIDSIERRGSRAEVLLKAGREFRLTSGDIGESLTVFDKSLGEVKVQWRDIDTIDFMDEPSGYAEFADESAYPIFGSVQTGAGLTLNGFIMWDNDESLSTDVIDGKERRRDRKIAFSRIKSIEPTGSRASELTLWTGKKVTLSGYQDVNSENKGLIVFDRDIGVVTVDWRDVEMVEFERNVSGWRYSDFKEPKPLNGTLVDENGDEYVGFIRWDNDESYTSDMLNGNYRDLELKIPFENIKEIRRRTRSTALVVLKSGKQLLMRGSNDVNNSNNGIFVLKSVNDRAGEAFEWDEFEKVIFKN